MRIGYACLAVGVPDTAIKGCTLKNASRSRLEELIKGNLLSLQNMIEYNERNGVSLFRISSDLVPFSSSIAYELPWRELFQAELGAIGRQIVESGLRVSMHPGQYTVLNSPVASVAGAAEKDLMYHTRILDSLGLGPEHKIVLHLGGVYGDKAAAVRRFVSRYRDLDTAVRRRLVLENDDSAYHIADVLETSSLTGAPVIYDNLHNAILPADSMRTDADWIRDCAATWRKEDGTQKVHFSVQHPDKRAGAHADFVPVDSFLEFYYNVKSMDPDIMLEVKDKNISALKCINCTSLRGVAALEAEWARYKYRVLESTPKIYGELRQMLRDKSAYPAVDFYKGIEAAMSASIDKGHAINAAQHVWGYFKYDASETEQRRFMKVVGNYAHKDGKLDAVKGNLYRLALKYRKEYLLSSYYFV